MMAGGESFGKHYSELAETRTFVTQSLAHGWDYLPLSGEYKPFLKLCILQAKEETMSTFPKSQGMLFHRLLRPFSYFAPSLCLKKLGTSVHVFLISTSGEIKATCKKN